MTPDSLGRLARCYGEAGFRPAEIRPAAPDDVRASHSSWAKRLATDRSRRIWLLRFDRPASAPVRR